MYVKTHDKKISDFNYEAVLKNSPDSLFILNSKGVILFANNKSQEIFGKKNTISNLTGEMLSSIIHPEHREHINEIINKCESGTDVDCKEIALIDKKGSSFPVLMSIAIVPKNTNNEKILICTAKAITCLKKLHRHLLQINEQERFTIARELHDNIGQTLTGIAYLIRAIKESMDSGSPVINEFSIIEDQLNNAIGQLRAISRGLDPIELNQNFEIVLEQLVKEAEKLYKAKINTKGTTSFDFLTREEAVHLYYIIREAVLNAIKYGKDKTIDIKISGNGCCFKICIQNNIDPSFTRKDHCRGQGIRIMRNRADIIGANLRIQRRNGKVNLIVEKKLDVKT